MIKIFITAFPDGNDEITARQKLLLSRTKAENLQAGEMQETVVPASFFQYNERLHRRGMDDEMNDFSLPVSDDQLRQEREKARTLRKTQWWRNRIGQGRCYYCGEACKASELTLDHLVPLVRGGRSSKGNCVPACKNCNNLKKDLLPIEWEDYLARLQSDKG
jgi:hypothetical protein